MLASKDHQMVQPQSQERLGIPCDFVIPGSPLRSETPGLGDPGEEEGKGNNLLSFTTTIHLA